MTEARVFQPTLTICTSANEVAIAAAKTFADAIRQNPKTVLGLATGGTPIATYQELIRMHKEDGLSFQSVTTFNLDEYIGLSADHPKSYRMFMQQELFDHIDIAPQNTYVPDGLADDVVAFSKAYESMIQDSGGIDLQLLGIGSNGHIAFNEPGTSAQSRTRKIGLADETIKNNARFFEHLNDVPTTAITMGVGTILEAKRIVLLATGESKADAIRCAVGGKVDPECPASFLQTHPDVTLIVDKAAAAGL